MHLQTNLVPISHCHCTWVLLPPHSTRGLYLPQTGSVHRWIESTPSTHDCLSRKFMRLEAFQREITTIYQRHGNGWLPGRIFIANCSLSEMGPKRAALNTSFPAWLCRSYTLACKFLHFTEKFARKAWLCLLILVTTLEFENEMVRTWIKLLTDRSKLTFQRRILPR